MIKYSPKRESLMKKLKDQVEYNSEGVVNENAIIKLPETQQTVQTGCFRRIIDKYDALMAV